MDVSARSDAMLLAFGALKGKLDVPPFEFFTVTGDMPVKRVFVRDLYQAWYHRGLSEEAPSLEATAEFLRQIIAEQDVSRLVVAGASAGGYAALLFGALLGADTVLSFCPQTSIDPRRLEEMEDRRWEERPRLLFEAGQLEPRWLDLRQALPRSRRAQTQFDVFFDETFRLDLLHAEHISEVEGVQLRRHRDAEHLITRKMRDSGELAQVLRAALEIRA
jgi:pimeloyl-ACP methyl ester carboxylesterase